MLCYSVVSDSVTLWAVACQASLSMGFCKQEYLSGLPFPSPGHLPDPWVELMSPALQADSLPAEPLWKPTGIKTDISINGTEQTSRNRNKLLDTWSNDLYQGCQDNRESLIPVTSGPGETKYPYAK